MSIVNVEWISRFDAPKLFVEKIIVVQHKKNEQHFDAAAKKHLQHWTNTQRLEKFLLNKKTHSD